MTRVAPAGQATRRRRAHEATGSRRVAVLHVVHPARIGGLETVVLELVSALRDAGHAVHVAAVMPPGDRVDHPFVAALDARGIPHTGVFVAGRDYRAERAAIRQLAADTGSRIVHTHGYRADVLHGLFAQRAGLAHVTTLHGFTGGDWRSRFYEWLQQRAVRGADTAIAVSRGIATRLASAGVSRVEVIQNAMPPLRPLDRLAARLQLGVAPRATVVGWVGRMSFEKAPELFVRAMARMALHVHGVMLGDGPMRPALRVLAQAHGVSDRVHLPGAVPQAARLLPAFDVLALTSLTEGTPMVLLEAMAAGVPIVATEVGGVPDVVTLATARLCASGDVEGIARAMSEALEDRDRTRRLMVAAAADVRARFSPLTWVARHEAVYQRVLTATG